MTFRVRLISVVNVLYLTDGTYFFWRAGFLYLGRTQEPFENFRISAGLAPVLLSFSTGCEEAFALKMFARTGIQRRELKKWLGLLKKKKFLQKSATGGSASTAGNLENWSGFNMAQVDGTAVDLLTHHPNFLKSYEKVKDRTLTGLPGLFAIRNSVQYLINAKIPGGFVECGVWRGGSMMLAALTLRELKTKDREIYLFDVFDGTWEAPKSDDGLMYQIENEFPPLQKGRLQFGTTFSAGTSTRAVRLNLQTTGYPSQRIFLIKGSVQSTLPKKAPDQIAFLRLDTDFYESTYHELEHLFPRLVTGGVLIVDDYGKYKGATRAVDDYFRNTKTKILLHRIDTQGAIGIKI